MPPTPRFVWTLRVTSPDRKAARVATRGQQFEVTRPIVFVAEHDGISALEYVLGAVGAVRVTGVREFARRRRLDVDDVEAVVRGELDNALTYLEVIGEAGHPAISRIEVKVYVASPDSEASVRTLFQEAVERLPLARTFRHLVRLDLDVIRTP